MSPVATASFTELTTELDKALSLVVEKKKALDELNKQSESLAKQHREAVERAKELRAMLTTLLNDSLGVDYPQNK